MVTPDRASGGAKVEPVRIEVRGLTQRFGDLLALDAIDLHAEAGEIVALIGPSGSGKSTLFRVLVGLDEPTEGELLIDGEPVRRPLGRTAYMPQRDGLLPWRRTIDNVTLGLEQAGMSRRAAREQARPLLERFGLGEFEQAWPWQLSGGMRQRAAFLRTVLLERGAMLLDEPFGALDGLTRADVQAWLLDVWEEVGTTVVLITHDVAEAVYLADRVYVLSARPGRVVAELKIDLPRPRPREILEDPAFAAQEVRVREALRTHGGVGSPPTGTTGAQA